MKRIKTHKIVGSKNNPRVIRDHKFEKLKKSISDFPEMLDKRPIICVTRKDKKFEIIGGNMRFRACQDLGYKEVPVLLADDWSEDQIKQFVIKDNVQAGEWDWDMLANEWKSDELNDWGFNDLNLGLIDRVNHVNTGDENSEWVGMPEFEVKEQTYKIIVHFDTEEYRQEFADLHKLQFMKKEKSWWSSQYPFEGREDLSSLKYE